MNFISLRKQAPEPAPDLDVEDVEPEETAESAADQVQEPGDVPGLLPALYQGARNWCAWCSSHIGVAPTIGVHVVAYYAATHYTVWVTFAVTFPAALLPFLFAPREALEQAAARLNARDAARDAVRAARHAEAAEEGGEDAGAAPVDPLVAVMWKLIGEASGVHLKTLTEVLAQAAEKRGEHPPSKAEVEAALDARGIPLRPSVRDAREKVNRGVYRDDLTAWESAPSPPETVPPATGP